MTYRELYMGARRYEISLREYNSIAHEWAQRTGEMSRFSLLEKFEPHCLSAIRIFQCFNRHNLWKFRQPTLYWESWRLCRSFINLTEWRQRRVTCQQLISYINTREKIRYFFHACCYGFSQGRKSLYNTAVYVIKYLLPFRGTTYKHLFRGKLLHWRIPCHHNLWSFWETTAGCSMD